MAGFISNVLSNLASKDDNYRPQDYGPTNPYTEHSSGSHGGHNNHAPGPPPQVPPPWRAHWDAQAGRWLFINEVTGVRTFEHPGGVGEEAGYYQGGPPPHRGGEYGGGYGGGYEQRGGYEGYGREGYGRERYGEGERRHGGGHHGLGAGALGAAAGLAGGALLMHEGERIENDWDREKYRMENRVEEGFQDVQDFPEDAARWTGRKVQDVEDIPQDIEQDYDRAKYGIENRFDNAVQDFEDIPQDIGQGIDDAAGWVGDKVGDVERFGDRIDQSYDEGRAEGRGDDW